MNIGSIEASTFSNLTKLQQLNLYGNNLTTLAENLFQIALTSLITLNLSTNLLGPTIPVNLLRNLNKLKTLDLSSNSIATINTNQLNGLTSLSYLDLSNNRISTIENNLFTSITLLSYLDLSSNLLKSIDKSQFNSLTSLTKLTFQSNPINRYESV